MLRICYAIYSCEDEKNGLHKATFVGINQYKIVGYLHISAFFVILVTELVADKSVISGSHLYKPLVCGSKKTDITKDCFSRKIFPARYGKDSNWLVRVGLDS